MREFDELYLSLSYILPLLCFMIYSISFLLGPLPSEISLKFPTNNDSVYLFHNKMYIENRSDKFDFVNCKGMMSNENKFIARPRYKFKTSNSMDNIGIFIGKKINNLPSLYEATVLKNINSDDKSLVDFLTQRHGTLYSFNKNLIPFSFGIYPGVECVYPVPFAGFFSRDHDVLSYLIRSLFVQTRMRFRLYENVLVVYISNDLIPAQVLTLQNKDIFELKNLTENDLIQNDNMDQDSNYKRIETITNIFLTGISPNTSIGRTKTSFLNTFALLLMYRLLDSYTLVCSFEQIIVLDGQDLVMVLKSPVKMPPTVFSLYKNVLTFSLLDLEKKSQYVLEISTDPKIEEKLLVFFKENVENKRLIPNLEFEFHEKGNEFLIVFIEALHDFDTEIKEGIESILKRVKL